MLRALIITVRWGHRIRCPRLLNSLADPLLCAFVGWPLAAFGTCETNRTAPDCIISHKANEEGFILPHFELIRMIAAFSANNAICLRHRDRPETCEETGGRERFGRAYRLPFSRLFYIVPLELFHFRLSYQNRLP